MLAISSRHCLVKPQHHLFRLRTSNQPLADGEYVSMESVVDYYDNRGLCSADELRNSLIKDYLRTVSGYLEKRLSSIIMKFIAHKDIYFELYDFVLYEQFPEDAIIVEGISAQQLATNYLLSPLGAYNYLIYLREMLEKALADLKAGLFI